MLKLIFYSTITLFLMISCNSNDEITNSNDQTYKRVLNLEPPNPYDSVGIIHNGIIIYAREDYASHDSAHFNYVSEINGEYYVDKTFYDDFNSSASDYLLTRGYSSAEVQAEQQKVTDLFSEAGLFTTIQGTDYIKDIRNNIPQIADAMLSLGYMSQDEYDVLSPFYEAVADMHYEDADSIMNAFNLTESVLSG